MNEPTLCACASARDGAIGLIRVSGSAVRVIASRLKIALPAAWTWCAAQMPVAQGACPVRVLFCPAGRSFTGEDVLEIALPGAAVVIEAVLEELCAQGAEPAGPGAFTRRALRHGRLSLDQAEGLLALALAGDARAARAALARLQGALAHELEPLRQELISLLAAVEAGLDFMDEEDVSAIDASVLRAGLQRCQTTVRRWYRAASHQGSEAVVCLVGPANAGKSALFNALAGAEALVSDEAGTTRDRLEACCRIGDRLVRLVDTAGWLMVQNDLDDAALAQATQARVGAALVIACSAPDAPVPSPVPPALAEATIIATKADLGVVESRAVLAVSAATGAGLEALRALIAERIGDHSSGEPRQQALLAVVDGILGRLLQAPLPEDLLLAEDLRAIDAALAELIGVASNEEVLDRIFSRFCIGK